MRIIPAFFSFIGRFVSSPFPPEQICCGQEVQPFGHGDPRVTLTARKLLREREKDAGRK